MAIRAGDVLFLDTNVLLAATDEGRAQHRLAQEVLVSANRHGYHLGVSGQVLREYLVVATRPLEVNGLGLSPGDALRNVDEFRRRSVLYDETEAVSDRLRQLVRDHEPRGKRIHDVSVVATMLTHGLTHLVTQNSGDFAGLPGVDILSLADVRKAMSIPDGGD